MMTRKTSVSKLKLLTLSLLLMWFAVAVFGQGNQGELRLEVVDSSGHGVRTQVHLRSDANQYRADLQTDRQGKADAARLPYGIYQLEVDQTGFAAVTETVAIRSSIPLKHLISLKLATVEETVSVRAANTLIDPEQPGNVDQVGSTSIERRLGTVPGRSLEDLVNSQPGWLFEGNAVLHPRGSENQTQFVVDGIPLTDNRSPSFGPEIGAEDVQSLSIYTAGIPAEYGRKLGGVIEVNTEQNAQPGFHGEMGLSAGSFNSGSAFARGQYTARKNTLDNRSSPNTEAGTTAKAEPQEAPKSTAQSLSEE